MSLQGTGWLRAIEISNSFAELKQSIEVATEQLGFQYFLYRGRLPDLRTKVYEFHLENCPDGWERGTGGDVAFDPLYRRALRGVTPVYWRELVPYEPAWIARARRYGLASGVTIPVHGPDGRWSSLSLVKSRSGAGVERYIRAAVGRCQLLAVFVHDVADRILRNQVGMAVSTEPGKAERCGLTDRERDCLIWLAAGKTTAQTASILAVAERTVVFHLTNARRKLGVVNSHHAIMKAVSLGHIKAA